MHDSLTKYIGQIKSLSTHNIEDCEKTSVLLLAIMDLVESKVINSNLIETSEQLRNAFSRNLVRFLGYPFSCSSHTVNMLFGDSQNHQPFFRFYSNDGKECMAQSAPNFDYVAIDKGLFNHMMMESSRALLRVVLFSTFSRYSQPINQHPHTYSEEMLSVMFDSLTLPFVRNSNLNPIVSDSIPTQRNIIYFALTSVSRGIVSFPITLHIAINTDIKEYNDVISYGESIIDSIDLPSVYLTNLIRLSKDDDFLLIKNDMISRTGIYDGGGQSIDYSINGCHQHLWCYCMNPLDGGPIKLSSWPTESFRQLRFYTGIERTYELVRKVLVREGIDLWFL